jgi:DNA-directed RNA polymerase subunit RPC12/RpoP
MQELKERAAYLRGLIQGSDLASDEKNRLVWEGLMDFCDGVAEDIEELEDSQTEFADYIEAIDEDLSSLEKYFYNTEDEDSDDPELLTSKDAETDDPVMELNCPHCKQELFFEDQPGNYEVVCPDCGSVVWQHFIAEHEPEIEDDPRQ